VAVSIGLYYRADSYSRAGMFDDRAKVLPQIGERDFCPGGTRGHAARNFYGCRH
jgi:hypothetical protein